MEEFLNSFQGRSTSQKILIVVGITVFLIFFISIMFFISTPKQKTALATPSPSPLVNNSTGFKTIDNQNSGSVLESVNGYKITYPSSWKKQTLSVTTGGTLTSFTVPYNSASEAFPRVDIQVTQSGTNITNEQRMSNLSILKLASGTATFKGQSVLKLSGVLPFDFKVAGTTKKVNKTFIFMTVNGKDYVIDYAYYVDENSQKNLQEIYKILDSFSFQ